MTYELDTTYDKLVIKKYRPIYDWERTLKWSYAPPVTETTHCMCVWSQTTLGL